MTTRSGRGVGRLRLVSVIGLAVASTLVGSACTAPGQITLRGPWTIPLPPIDTTGPATTVPVIPGVCETVYTPEGIILDGVTVTVPAVSINLTGVIDVPDVTVRIPAATVALPAFQVNCLGVGIITLAAQVVIPATAVIENAQLDLTTGVLTLEDPSVTIHGVGLHFPGLGGLTIPISLTIPIGTVTVPL